MASMAFWESLNVALTDCLPLKSSMDSSAKGSLDLAMSSPFQDIVLFQIGSPKK
jgi:hypothetical protein